MNIKNKHISRLKKIAADESYVIPGPIFIDDWKWVENDDITKTQYHTNIDRTWKFEQPIDDNIEWELQK